MKIIKTKKYAQLKDSNTLISIIQSYIDFIKQFPVYEEDYKKALAIAYFEQIIEGINIETVLYDKLVEKGFGRTDRDIIQHLQDLQPLSSGADEENANLIRNVFETYYDRDNVVRGNLFFMDSIPEVWDWMSKNSKFGDYGR